MQLCNTCKNNLRMCQLIRKYFCVVYDYAAKADLSIIMIMIMIMFILARAIEIQNMVTMHFF